MGTALDNLQHLVVLMMENRSFDHMLGGLKKQYPKINGLAGNEANPDTTGAMVQVTATAQFEGQLKEDPDHHFPGVDLQIFGGSQASDRTATMQGFIKSYFTQANNVKTSRAIMSYFAPAQLPVLTTLATEYAVFNGWFSSIPGPTICNRAFAHYGTSFGQVSMDIFYLLDPILSAYERMIAAGKTAKIYYYDQTSSTMEIVNLLKNQPQLFGTFPQFLADCKSEPCRNTPSSSPATTTTRETTEGQSWRVTSIPTTTSAKARGLSRPFTTLSGPTLISGTARPYSLFTMNTADTMTTSFLPHAHRTDTWRSLPPRTHRKHLPSTA